MNEALNATLCNLYSRGFLERTNDLDTLFHYRFLYRGRLIDEEVDIVPALHKKALREIVHGAINGSLPDMTTVAMMYSSGFALPQHLAKAEAWACFAVTNPAPSVTYTEAIAELKLDYEQAKNRARDDRVWPEAFEAVIDKVLRKVNVTQKYVDQDVGKGVFVTPRIAGVRVNLVYRAYKRGEDMHAHLYAAFLHIGDKIIYGIDQLRLIQSIPIELGTIRDRKVITHYSPFGETVKLYVVTGTLAVPRTLREPMREHFPEVNTVSDMLREYLSSLSRSRLDDFGFVVVELREQLAKVNQRIDTLNKRADESGKMSEKAKDNLAKLKSKAAKLKGRIKNSAEEQEKARAEYVNKLPENYLRFVASDLFTYQNGKLMGTKLQSHTHTHLQSLGFHTLRHPLVEILGLQMKNRVLSGLDNVIDKFEKAFDDQYKVTGLNIRPCSETVNIKRCYTYSKSKGE